MRAKDDVHGLNVALGDFGLSSRAADRAEYSPAGAGCLECQIHISASSLTNLHVDVFEGLHGLLRPSGTVWRM